MATMPKPLDRCGLHYAPCPFQADEEPCPRCDGNGEVENNGGKGYPLWCPKCGDKGTLAKVTPEWLDGGRR